MPHRLRPLFWLVGAKGIRFAVITGAKSVILKMLLSFVTLLQPWLLRL